MPLLILEESGSMKELQTKFDKHISKLSESGKFSGSVLVSLDGKIVLSKGYGMANYELDVPNTPQTVFRIGSLTKQFTALAVMQLVEKGLIALEDRITKYLPVSALEEVTIHHLLSHTSGIWNYTDSPEFLKNCIQFHSVDNLIKTFIGEPNEFKLGEKFSYSNSGYALLGKLIELVSGKTYEAYLDEKIFNPLGMKYTGYDHEEIVIKGRASGYSIDENSNLKNAEYIDMSVPYSSGGLYSTIEDMYVWDQSLFTEKLLTKNVFEKMVQPYSEEGFGYGWITLTHNNRKVIGHSGGIPGFASMYLKYLEDKGSIIILSNILSDTANDLSWELGEMLFD